MLSLPDIDSFFKELDREFRRPLTVLITGAVAGFIMGHIRPSDDIDFEVDLPEGEATADVKQALAAAIKSVSQKLQMPAQYTENIAGWSQIALMDYKRTALPYKKIGNINIKFLAPEYWAIGKFTRYLPLDRKDLIGVLKATNGDATELITVLAKALRSSPLSDRSLEFKNHVVDFLKNDGIKIWGNGFSHESAVEEFKKLAGL